MLISKGEEPVGKPVVSKPTSPPASFAEKPEGMPEERRTVNRIAEPVKTQAKETPKFKETPSGMPEEKRTVTRTKEASKVAPVDLKPVKNKEEAVKVEPIVLPSIKADAEMLSSSDKPKMPMATAPKFELNIKKERSKNLAEKDSTGKHTQTQKSLVILHQTGGELGKGVLEGRKDPVTGDYYGAHYYIAKDGIIHQRASELDVVYHAGKGNVGGEGDINNRALGIEIESLHLGDKASRDGGYYEELTPAQLESVSKLLANWVMENNIKESELPYRLFGHAEITAIDNKAKTDSAEGYKDPVKQVKRFGESRFMKNVNYRKVDFDSKNTELVLEKIKELLKAQKYF